MNHTGKGALVTGGGSGIGRATARRLAAEGAHVAVLDVSPERAAETVELIAFAGGQALAVTADVRDRARVVAAVDTAVGRLGRLDFLVNNAGVVTMTGFADLTEEEWDYVVDVNLKGYFLVTQAAAPYIRKGGGGAVVCISTVEADVVVSSTGHCQVHYNASKGGVKMLTKALAAELAPDGIRVNAVAPGAINTRFVGADLTAIPEAMEFLMSRALIQRIGEPEDIAAAVSFLLSDDASYITGVQLPVDGGWLVR
jgi:glucose 1-dehydrogenase/3-oxoacyl-[acyl-carrier protein] reductase